ncbi:MAG: hypothetical protein ACREJ4_10410 [Candidatus Methylomirabilaceae bacterium]
MRRLWNLAAVLVATTVLITGLTVTGPLPVAGGFGDGGGNTNQVIREGQVVEITDTTITIREWAGKYTYRLSATGRQSLQANNIKPGDKVRFNAYSVWEIAYNFWKF